MTLPPPPPIGPKAVRFHTLGGLGEVGMNCAILETASSLLLIDCGVNFPETDHYGVDVHIPDFAFLDANRDRLRGLVLTHGHQDHIGAVPWLLREFDLPIWGSKLALAMVHEALEEHGLHTTASLNEVRAGDVIDIAEFAVEFIHTNHSIPECMALAIDTPVGRMIHTGDFKVDHTPIDEDPIDLPRFAELGDEGVRVLFSDSTNVERPGTTGSERVAREMLIEAVRRASGRVFVALFSSNLFRVQSLIEAAHRSGRRILTLGWSLNRNIRIGRELGLLKLPGEDPFIEVEDAQRFPPEKLLVLSTGSQGEPRAALNRVARGDFKGLALRADDLVIFSSRMIPGNERAVFGLQDLIARAGASILTPQDMPIHVSGHACREEQKLLIGLCRPEVLVPVHGDHRFLVRHAALGEEAGVPEQFVLDNGDVLELTKDSAQVVGHHKARRIIVENGIVGVADSEMLRDRARLARLGYCVIWAIVDGETGTLEEGPVLQMRGIVEEGEAGEDLLQETREAATKAFEGLAIEARRNRAEVADALRLAVRRYFRRKLQRKPFVEPIVYIV